MTKIYLNNELINLTLDQETKRLEEVAADKTAKDARIATKTETDNKKTSGKQKLLDLGLSEEEVKALMGA
tara:strand:- start:569 stop:778 length:210 start_codon:yes stop_codon:yes gene_type:complete